MGKRGPAPQPTVLKLLKGNPGKRALNAREPKAPPVVEMPPPPKWLSEHGADLWRQLGPRLIRSKVLAEIDLAAFGMLCNAYHEFRRADEVIAKEGLTYETTTTTGDTKYAKRPEVEIRADAFRRTLRMMQEFGLTASSRSGVQADPGKPADPFGDFMGRGKARG